MKFYKSPNGGNLVENSIKVLKVSDRIKVSVALENLSKGDTKGLNIKPFRKSIFELKIGKYRVFYTKNSTDIIILYFFKKDSKKIPTNDADIVLKRYKDTKNIT